MLYVIMLQSSSSCSGREWWVQGHVKYEILSIKLWYTALCCGWVTVVLSCKSQTLEIKDRPVDLFHAGNRWPSMCCSVCASLSCGTAVPWVLALLPGVHCI